MYCLQAGEDELLHPVESFWGSLGWGMQEYLSVPADHLIRTEKLDFDQMAMVECLGIGAHAVRRAQDP